jgi:hypothetical protein
MGQVNIPVTIDASGNISCQDATVPAGTLITWPVTGGTISNITPGRPSPFSSNPTISNGQWSATVVAAGSYTITDLQGKQRTPKIALVTPMKVKSH